MDQLVVVYINEMNVCKLNFFFLVFSEFFLDEHFFFLSLKEYSDGFYIILPV